MGARLRTGRRPVRRGLLPWFLLLPFVLVNLVSLVVHPVRAQGGSCEPWAWFVYHTCTSPGPWCGLSIDRATVASMNKKAVTVFGSYRTEGEAVMATCGAMSNLRRVGGPGAIYPGVKADIQGDVYDVGAFSAFNSDGTVQCRGTQPDADGDGVPDTYPGTKMPWDQCPNTLAGPPVAWTGCPCEEKDECNEYCKGLGAHQISDGTSTTLENCTCICEKGWALRPQGDALVCVPCEELCKAGEEDPGDKKEKDDHRQYDENNSADNMCACACEDGYDDKLSAKCELVDCPDNSRNIATLQRAGAAYVIMCRRQYTLNRHCCCKNGYLPRDGLCVKQGEPERQPFGTYEGPTQPDPESCARYGVKPKDFDLVFDLRMLNWQFVQLMEQYKGPLYRGSAKFDWSKTSASDFFYHLGFTEGKKFLTGGEAKLGRAIEARAKKEGKGLTPTQVLEESLRLNNGYVFDALLTCHNLLREETGKRRKQLPLIARLAEAEELLKNAQSKAERAAAQSLMQRAKKQIATHSNLFPSLMVVRTKTDNSGAWYHLFGAMSAGYAFPNFGPISLSGEKAYRIKYKSAYDPTERCWDDWAATVGWRIQELDKIKYKRPVSPALGPDPAAIKTGYRGGSVRGSGP
ncbi:hypothetical protein ACFLWA_04740 [Chloroflexota bacterium]